MLAKFDAFMTGSGRWIGVVFSGLAIYIAGPFPLVGQGERLDEWHGMSAQLRGTLTLQNSVQALTDPVHPGTLRYYREIGVKIKKTFKLTKADLKRGKGKKGGKK